MSQLKCGICHWTTLPSPGALLYSLAGMYIVWQDVYTLSGKTQRRLVLHEGLQRLMLSFLQTLSLSPPSAHSSHGACKLMVRWITSLTPRTRPKLCQRRQRWGLVAFPVYPVWAVSWKVSVEEAILSWREKKGKQKPKNQEREKINGLSEMSQTWCTLETIYFKNINQKKENSPVDILVRRLGAQ